MDKKPQTQAERIAELAQAMATELIGQQALQNIRLQAENITLKERIAQLESPADTTKDG